MSGSCSRWRSASSPEVAVVKLRAERLDDGADRLEGGRAVVYG